MCKGPDLRSICVIEIRPLWWGESESLDEARGVAWTKLCILVGCVMNHSSWQNSTWQNVNTLYKHDIFYNSLSKESINSLRLLKNFMLVVLFLTTTSAHIWKTIDLGDSGKFAIYKWCLVHFWIPRASQVKDHCVGQEKQRRDGESAQYAARAWGRQKPGWAQIHTLSSGRVWPWPSASLAMCSAPNSWGGLCLGLGQQAGAGKGMRQLSEKRRKKG